MPLLGWVTDGREGYRAEVSGLAGGWQEFGDFYPVQLGATGRTAIAGLELFVGVKTGLAFGIHDGFHAPEAEGGGFSPIIDLDVEFV